MRFVDEFRDGAVARGLARAIAAAADPRRRYRLMEFCGGHTHAIHRYGLLDLLPDNVQMIHGPGCPVCVLPVGRIEDAIHLALEEKVILASYGDPLRVPAGGGRSLLQARSRGADVRLVYSTADALEIARRAPARTVVFFAIGFETTAPATAVAVLEAARAGLANFKVFANHVLTPAAIAHLLESPELRRLGRVEIDGFLGPSHVSAVIGSRPYEFFAAEHEKPVVIAGFEPLDVLGSILMLIRQLNEGRAEVENEYARVVTREGNVKAQALVSDVFELRKSFEWRGLGAVPYSALRIRGEYAAFDAEVAFRLPGRRLTDSKACACGAILRGVKRPTDCALFATACTPDDPKGSCMVSSEGACAAWYRYGRFREPAAAGAPA